MDIVAPATPGNGIEVLSESRMKELLQNFDNIQVSGMCKFVPASGAASRMFKDIFAMKQEAVLTLTGKLEDFAFYDPEIFGKAPFDPQKTADLLLEDKGLGYGKKPKAVLKFHRYENETRTPFDEHLVEGAAYMNDGGKVKVVFTISEEHRPLFEKALDKVKKEYEERYGVTYDVSFSCQDKSTDTIAVNPDNTPFITNEGKQLFRPGGHGALIYNLDALEEELVSIKNIDNVAAERLLPVTVKWKKALISRALELRDRIFGYLHALDEFLSLGVENPYPSLPGYNALQEDTCANEECQSLCREIEQFLYDELCVEMPEARSCKERALMLHDKLNRPVRVCGMVRNEGECGGGPFIIRSKDGSTSLQILESVQINMDDPSARKALETSTHFNPVDIICCLHNYNGQKFNLIEHVDKNAGFISSKSCQGRELKALELPGLWNGAMSDWNTLFVEVPVETFNPVKTILDLLKQSHQ